MLDTEIFIFCNLNIKLDMYRGDSGAVRVAIWLWKIMLNKKEGNGD